MRFNTISEESLGLNNKILEILQKKESGLSQWKTFSGVEDLIASEMHTYRLPLVRIGKKRFYDVEVTEDHGEEEGCMGNGLIGLQNVLLDFPHSLIYMSNQCDKLAKAGYPINRWVQIPFQKTGNGSAVIEVCMDGGTKKLALGTGSCDSLLIGQEDADANGEGGVFTTSRLIIGGKDFGSMDLERVKPNELFEFDGILGMNFLAKHPVYIDYVHQNLYLE